MNIFSKPCSVLNPVQKRPIKRDLNVFNAIQIAIIVV
jgi:hypothetical protein